MKFKCLLIAVENMEESRRFYEDILNQIVAMDFGANITFADGFSLQTKLSWAEFIGKEEQEILRDSKDFELYFEEDDFDAFLERIKMHEIRYVHKEKEFPWGQRVIRFYDPDSHIVEVGESMESVVKRFIKQGLSVEETAVRTQHPLDFVKQCLE